MASSRRLAVARHGIRQAEHAIERRIDVAESLSHLHRIPGLAAALSGHEQPATEAA
ncbi:hypothetical protein [Burkholderia multivorans]|uniref:hypothetical protein n=1 Tax=Burkholderia multivorans TaxID=87883 RepID=UPI000B201D07|nr:hypothetical protein [Burkholderia multivorans]MBU9618989.1 hypothetical protein [Burkholderia multivorans]MCA8317137.1 hypothetical protein [Burkholderia multivorans]NGM76405.1 hypothetical protein [Burkholderia multivorans]